MPATHGTSEIAARASVVARDQPGSGQQRDPHDVGDDEHRRDGRPEGVTVEVAPTELVDDGRAVGGHRGAQHAAREPERHRPPPGRAAVSGRRRRDDPMIQAAATQVVTPTIRRRASGVITRRITTPSGAPSTAPTPSRRVASGSTDRFRWNSSQALVTGAVEEGDHDGRLGGDDERQQRHGQEGEARSRPSAAAPRRGARRRPRRPR